MNKPVADFILPEKVRDEDIRINYSMAQHQFQQQHIVSVRVPFGNRSPALYEHPEHQITSTY